MKKNFTFLVLLIFTCNLIFAQELPRRPFMGIALAPITEDIQASTRYTSTQGVFIRQVFDQSSAKASGLTAGDIITHFEGKPVEGVRAFLQELRKYKTGDQLDISLFSEGKKINKKLTLTPMPKEKNEAFETIYSSIQNGKNHQRLILTKPSGTGQFPAVMLLQGVGCVSSEFPFEGFRGPTYSIIDSLTRAGYVTLRVERSGMGDSQGQPCQEIDFQTDFNGFRQSLKYLKKLDYVDTENIFLMGFSMGGVIGPALANEIPVKGIIAYGTAGINWLDYEVENSKRQYALWRGDFDSLGYYTRLEQKRLNQFYVEKMSPEEIIKANPEDEQYFRRKMGIYPMHYTYFQQVADLNTPDLWYNCNAHALAIHGETDFVSAATDHQLIADIVNGKNPGRGTYIELPESDHWFNKAKTVEESRDRNNLEVNLVFIDLALDWMQKILEAKS